MDLESPGARDWEFGESFDRQVHQFSSCQQYRHRNDSSESCESQEVSSHIYIYIFDAGDANDAGESDGLSSGFGMKTTCIYSGSSILTCLALKRDDEKWLVMLQCFLNPFYPLSLQCCSGQRGDLGSHNTFSIRRFHRRWATFHTPFNPQNLSHIRRSIFFTIKANTLLTLKVSHEYMKALQRLHHPSPSTGIA